MKSVAIDRIRFFGFAACGLVALGFAVPSASAATRVASYCTPTGDYCHGIFRTPGGAYYFDLRTFSFRGSVQVCVAKRTRVCRSRTLRATSRGLYQARIYWASNYPNQGAGRYAVSWHWQGNKIGRTLYSHARPQPDAGSSPSSRGPTTRAAAGSSG